MLENFPSEKYAKDKYLYFTLELTEETLYKNIGYVRVAMQRANVDGTYDNLLEREGYYSIKDDMIYGADNMVDVIRYHQQDNIVYQYNDNNTGLSEQLWFDQYADIVYIAKEIEDETGNGWITVVEQYQYQKNGDTYTVIARDGDELFKLKTLGKDICIDQKIYIMCE